MGRSRCTVRSAQRRGTPALSTRYKTRRPLSRKLCETITEEPGLEKMIVPSVRPVRPVRSSVKPVCCKAVPHSGKPRHRAIPASPPNKPNRVSPAQLPTVQTTPDPRKEGEGKLAVTPESTTSSKTEEDTSTFGSDVSDSDCYSSASSSSSSLPSPEIFRRESCVQTLTFSMKEEEEEEEEQGPHLHIKNSTLLDVSHAETIHIHDPPGLSAIIDASTVLAEEICDISKHKGPEAETSTQTGPVQPDKSTAKPRKPPSCLLQITGKRPMLCKKKVSFKTPFIAETFGSKHSPATRSAADDETSSLVKQPTQPDVEEASSFRDETAHLTVNLRRAVENSQDTVKLFDFVSDGERDVLFEMMRERSVKLKNIPLFPLTAAEVT